MDGFHHLHLRKRIYKQLEPFPHPDAVKRFFDRSMAIIALAGPLATLPQVIQVYAEQDASGLSLLTWIIWLFLSALWLIYGLLHRELPIVLAHIAYLAVYIVIITAIVIY